MIIIDKEKCVGCGNCAKDCFGYNLSMEHGKMEVKGNCFECGHCIALCPVSAIHMDNCPDDEFEECSGQTENMTSRQLLHTIKCRRSIRNYQKRTVEKELLTEILQAGRYTPTGGNAQDVRYTVVQDRLPELIPQIFEGVRQGAEQFHKEKPDNPYSGTLNRIYEKYKNGQDSLFFEAPVLLLISSDMPIDGALAASNIELMAATEGLGCLYSGFIELGLKNNPEALKLIQIDAEKLRCCMLLGYPGITYIRSVPRKALQVKWM
ncbi:nitroreductase family protein [Ruminococcus sp. AF31-8BH]|uniref:nitroreductase family protein n=1 Tax=Ruminococcus sp. AF31-8BH TaxID=2293174 RepID=UPI000E52A89C|nr:nitroreductase family protein [Ruminococcus sp. AF31-8BH]RGF74187.1 nitroreductase [Ruminococcus sp. AF31-8BH]